MTRTVGFELEISNTNLTISFSELEEKIKEIARQHNQQAGRTESARHWTIKTDASCGYELTSPAIEANPQNFQQAARIIDGVRELLQRQSAIRKTCGFHVHIDVQDYTTNDQHRSLINLFRCYEGSLLELQPRSRRQNDYVRLLSNIRGLDGISDIPRNSYMQEHYTAVNYRSYSARKTIEIRYGAGTLKSDKIFNWIKLLLVLVEAAKNKSYMYLPCNFQGMVEFVRMTQTSTFVDETRNDLVNWIISRRQELIDQQTRRSARQTGRS